MQICPNCTHHNRDGTLVCEHCQQAMNGHTLLATRQMDRIFDFETDDELFPVQHQGVPNGCLVLQLLDTPESLLIEVQDRVIIGRVGPHTVNTPDVDLAPYNAFKSGVSSQHAAIYRVGDNYKITDMGSLNGTYLNREGLVANAGYTLHSGDLIHLGKLALQVLF